MQVKLTRVYKGVTVELSANVDPQDSKARNALVTQLDWTCQSIDERLHPGESVHTSVPKNDNLPVDENDLDEEDQEYLLITDGQKQYLKKLGVSEKKIDSIKTKKEASALITKLQKGE